ncbi:hypothetical protein Sfulv_24160 [Streptomyces fulvorobeus]|uniref:Uncharacterized protein n=1 Tax=Streptomyces fulvorobeus TaxID=284028 RepID=A0A7J0C4Y8_9ACTN|nr:hypothetical protein Sfulv_24160 [Streptomyces fulvorobeus]
MVTFAQAQERADEWVNGDVPGYQHREVCVREFELGFVVWAEDRADGPVSDGGRHRLVIARDSGEATLWPGIAVGEVIRRYEEEYGGSEHAPAAAVPAQRIDLNQTSFLLTPPEWFQEAADRVGIPDRRAEVDAGGPPSQATPLDAGPSPAAPAPASPGGASSPGGPALPRPAAGGQGDHEPTAADGVPASPPASPSGVPSGATPWAGTDTNADPDAGAVGLPVTVFAPPLSGADDEEAPSPVVPAEAPTALMPGGSRLPRTAVSPVVGAPGQDGPAPGPTGPGDIADLATGKAAVPPRGARGTGPTPPPPPVPPAPRVCVREPRRRLPDRVRPGLRRVVTHRPGSSSSSTRPAHRSRPVRLVRPVVPRRRPVAGCTTRRRCSPTRAWAAPGPRPRPARPVHPVRTTRPGPPAFRARPGLPVRPVVPRRRPVAGCITRRRCSPDRVSALPPPPGPRARPVRPECRGRNPRSRTAAGPARPGARRVRLSAAADRCPDRRARLPGRAALPRARRQ